MSHAGLPKFEALLDALVQAIDGGQDWQHLRPVVIDALECFASVNSVRMWIRSSDCGPPQYFSLDLNATATPDMPAPCMRALNESRVVETITLDFSKTHNPDTSAILVPRTVALPCVNGSDDATICRFVVGVEWKLKPQEDGLRTAALKSTDEHLQPSRQSDSPAEQRRLREAAGLAVADCLTGFVLRWLLSLSTAQQLNAKESTAVAGGDPFNGNGPTTSSVNAKPSAIAASLARQLPLCTGLQSWADNVSILGVSWLRDGRMTVAEVAGALSNSQSNPDSAVRLLSVNGIGIGKRESRTGREVRYWVRQLRNQRRFSQWVPASELRQSDFVLSSTEQDSISTAVRCEEIGSTPGQGTILLVLECLRNSEPPPEEELEQIRSVVRATLGPVMHRESLKAQRRSNRLWVSAGCFLAAMVWFSLPTDFQLEVEGQVFPEQRRRIFAPENAIVDQVLVEENADVREGTELIVLRSPELDLELSRLEGELSAVETRVRTLRALRAVNPQNDSSVAQRSGVDLSTEEQQATAQLQNLKAQLEMISARREALRINAPLTGTVHRRRSTLDLAKRPVNRGQVLLEIGDTSEDAEWVAVLLIPDAFSGYLSTAFEESEEPGNADSQRSLSVQFATVGESQNQYSAVLTEWSAITDFDGGTLNREVVARIPSPVDRTLRPGMRVRARINCGRRSRGFVWFREFVEFMQRKSFVWF